MLSPDIVIIDFEGFRHIKKDSLKLSICSSVTSVFPVKLQGGTQVSSHEHYRGETSVFPVKQQGDTSIFSLFFSESYGGEGGHLD